MCITLSCWGPEARIVLVGWLFASLPLRRYLAFSERNYRRYPFFSSSLTSISSEMHSSVLWLWSLWNFHHRFGFRNVSGAFIFWGNLTCVGPSTSERWPIPVFIWRDWRYMLGWHWHSFVFLYRSVVVCILCFFFSFFASPDSYLWEYLDR